MERAASSDVPRATEAVTSTRPPATEPPKVAWIVVADVDANDPTSLPPAAEEIGLPDDTSMARMTAIAHSPDEAATEAKASPCRTSSCPSMVLCA